MTKKLQKNCEKWQSCSGLVLWRGQDFGPRPLASIPEELGAASTLTHKGRKTDKYQNYRVVLTASSYVVAKYPKIPNKGGMEI